MADNYIGPTPSVDWVQEYVDRILERIPTLHLEFKFKGAASDIRTLQRAFLARPRDAKSYLWGDAITGCGEMFLSNVLRLSNDTLEALATHVSDAFEVGKANKCRVVAIYLTPKDAVEGWGGSQTIAMEDPNDDCTEGEALNAAGAEVEVA